jgi:hypothetical protein
MRTFLTPQAESPRTARNGQRRSAAAISFIAALLAAPLLLATMDVHAQTVADKTAAATSTRKAVARHKKPVAAQQTTAPAPVSAPVPVVPEAPKWPANDQPNAATVIWDSQGLRIVASNSSLSEILQDVATKTGAKLEGLDTDQRVFGAYGPGQARDVLAQLLDGSGYNIVMVGDQGQGTPRQIVLSARSTAGAKTPSNGNVRGFPGSEDDAAEVEEQEPPQPPQQQQGPGQNGAMRSPMYQGPMGMPHSGQQGQAPSQPQGIQ